ncbi:protein VTE6, chloroplastic-like, partial [Mangifera indica]|uniref:protein VTE6, chloroplastic-like n=1 Tax=Mangifera indica TaxID=29780 RepID=UPI001CFADF7E
MQPETNSDPPTQKSEPVNVIKSPPVPSVLFRDSNLLQKVGKSKFNILNCKYTNFNYNLNHSKMLSIRRADAVPSIQGAVSEAMSLMQSDAPTWQSALLSNIVIFVLGSPILLSGLSTSGIAAAFFLGTLTWRAFGPYGFLLVATFFVIGTAATKVKMAQKEVQGLLKRGKEEEVLSIYGVGGKAFYRLRQLRFVSGFCTKLSDTVSSEIGKAYGKTT